MFQKKRKTIYESDLCGSNAVLASTTTRSEYVTASNGGRVSTFRADHIALPGLQASVSRLDHTITESSNSISGSRYRKKSGGSSSKRMSKKRNTFAELQIPTVSDNGATRNRMACYNRKIIVHSDLQSYALTGGSGSSSQPHSVKSGGGGDYFCPQAVQKSYYGGVYEHADTRTFPRYGYQEKDLI